MSWKDPEERYTSQELSADSWIPINTDNEEIERSARQEITVTDIQLPNESQISAQKETSMSSSTNDKVNSSRDFKRLKFIKRASVIIMSESLYQMAKSQYTILMIGTNLCSMLYYYLFLKYMIFQMIHLRRFILYSSILSIACFYLQDKKHLMRIIYIFSILLPTLEFSLQITFLYHYAIYHHNVCLTLFHAFTLYSTTIYLEVQKMQQQNNPHNERVLLWNEHPVSLFRHYCYRILLVSYLMNRYFLLSFIFYFAHRRYIVSSPSPESLQPALLASISNVAISSFTRLYDEFQNEDIFQNQLWSFFLDLFLDYKKKPLQKTSENASKKHETTLNTKISSPTLPKKEEKTDEPTFSMPNHNSSSNQTSSSNINNIPQQNLATEQCFTSQENLFSTTTASLELLLAHLPTDESNKITSIFLFTPIQSKAISIAIHLPFLLSILFLHKTTTFLLLPFCILELFYVLQLFCSTQGQSALLSVNLFAFQYHQSIQQKLSSLQNLLSKAITVQQSVSVLNAITNSYSIASNQTQTSSSSSSSSSSSTQIVHHKSFNTTESLLESIHSKQHNAQWMYTFLLELYKRKSIFVTILNQNENALLTRKKTNESNIFDHWFVQNIQKYLDIIVSSKNEDELLRQVLMLSSSLAGNLIQSDVAQASNVAQVSNVAQAKIVPSINFEEQQDDNWNDISTNEQVTPLLDEPSIQSIEEEEKENQNKSSKEPNQENIQENINEKYYSDVEIRNHPSSQESSQKLDDNTEDLKKESTENQPEDGSNWFSKIKENYIPSSSEKPPSVSNIPFHSEEDNDDCWESTFTIINPEQEEDHDKFNEVHVLSNDDTILDNTSNNNTNEDEDGEDQNNLLQWIGIGLMGAATAAVSIAANQKRNKEKERKQHEASSSTVRIEMIHGDDAET